MAASSLRSLARCPQLICVAGREAAPVDVDLVVDEPEVLRYLFKPGRHSSAVEFQEREPFPFVTRPGGHELGVAADGPDGHARGPQLRADDDPVEIKLAVPPTAAVSAVNRGNGQAGTFVVAESVHADPGAAGSLGDGYALRWDSPGRLRSRSGLDFEHALNHTVAVMRASALAQATGDRRGQRVRGTAAVRR